MATAVTGPCPRASGRTRTTRPSCCASSAWSGRMCSTSATAGRPRSSPGWHNPTRGGERADVLDFSNGGQTALELGMHHPDQVRRLVVASAFYKRDGAPAGFWAGMAKAQFSDMPQLYKDAYLKINPDPAGLLNMFHKDAARMQGFQGWTDADIRSIGAPTLVVIGDRDVVRPEHAVEMSELL